MSIKRSTRYEQIHDEVWDQYVTKPDNLRDMYWWLEVAPKWRNRVGIPRLVANQASSEAVELLRSINPGMFRNDPDMLKLLRTAQEATQAFSNALGADSWRRFQGDAS
ncbi:hypothetical protein [Pseudactinotalea sp.]|uniref:hypothetical protein n=1 Tax=Pseudactinotalea sp. TaxID=1926260 RepID=UPI003B3A9E74